MNIEEVRWLRILSVQAETPLQGGKVPGIYFDFATIVVILHRKMTFEMAFFAFFD